MQGDFEAFYLRHFKTIFLVLLTTVLRFRRRTTATTVAFLI